MTENKKIEDDVYNQKCVAYYSASVSAWFNTRLEKTKQLLTLSSLAIGLIMFFYKELQTTPEFVVWIIAGACFLLCILLCLWVLEENATYLMAVVQEKDDHSNVSNCIKYKAKAASFLFLLGVVLAFSLTIIKSDFSIQKNIQVKMEIEDVKK